jgi:hypothetical protein
MQEKSGPRHKGRVERIQAKKRLIGIIGRERELREELEGLRAKIKEIKGGGR